MPRIPKLTFRQRTLRMLVLALGVVGPGGCGPSLLARGSHHFAMIVQASARPLVEEPTTLATLCRQQARLDYLRSRIEPGSSTTTASLAEAALIFPREASPGPQAATCGLRNEDEEAYRQAVTATVGFAQTVNAVATGTPYEGQGLVQSSQALSRLASQLNAPASVASGLGYLGEPLRRIAVWALQRRGEREVSDKLEESATTFGQVIDQLERLIQLDVQRHVALRTSWNGAAQLLEAKLTPQPGRSGGLESIGLLQFLSSGHDALEAISREQELRLHLLTTIRAAHAELRRVAAAAPRRARQKALKQLADYETEVVRLVGETQAVSR